MAAILKNDRKMPFYQRKKFNPMFFCLFIPLTCIINEKINLPKKIPRHYISARTICLLGYIYICNTMQGRGNVLTIAGGGGAKNFYLESITVIFKTMQYRVSLF